MNILPFLPGGNQSITRKWMEHQPNEKDQLVALALGILSVSVSYYYERAYLITGATCFALSYGLKREPLPEQSMALGIAETINETPTPIRIMRFIVLSSFIGKCIQESWIKPTVLPNKAWKPYLLKAPFHIISFNQILACTNEEISAKIGKRIPHFINKDPNEREILITAIFILSISASTTYMVPGLNLIFGTMAISTFFGIGKATASEKSKVIELMKLGSTSLKLAMLIAVGGTIGSLTRSIIGPKNHALPYSLATTLLLLPHAGAFPMLIGLSLIKGKEQDILDSIGRKIPKLELHISRSMPLINKFAEYTQTLRTKTAAEIIQEILVLQSELQRLLPEFLDLYYEEYEEGWLTEVQMARYMKIAEIIETNMFKIVLGFSVWLLSESKQQTVDRSIDELTHYFEVLRSFYNKVAGKEVTEYIPKNKDQLVNKEEEERDLLQRLENGSLRQSHLGWTKEQAAYLLLAPVDDRTAQTQNYRVFSLWFHPDKNPENERAAELFKAVNKANEILGS